MAIFLAKDITRKVLSFPKCVRKNVHTGVKQNDKEKDIVERLLEKYKNLRSNDRIKLISSHLKNVKEKNVEDIYEFVKREEEEKEIQEEYEVKKRMRILKLRKPAYLQSKSVKKKVNNDFDFSSEYTEKTCLQKEKELKDIEKYTLIEDMYKAYIYSKAYTMLNNKYITKHNISNDFVHVMVNTIRQYILEKIRPTLINEFGVYTNPYMLFKNSLQNYLLNQYVKNAYEETLMDDYINRKTSLNILKINSANVPVEVFEPLASFRGDVHYNFDPREKFKVSIGTSLRILGALTDAVNKGAANKGAANTGAVNTGAANTGAANEVIDNPSREQGGDKTKMYEREDDLVNKILSILPENKKFPFENYPFENLKSFRTHIQKKYIGGIKNSKPLNIEEEELNNVRYPNLQCVAHSLPRDVKYRDNVIHAIKVLERSKHWDHASKIKAINTLIDVWNNMHSSGHYENVLDKALPAIYTKDMLRKTRTRKDTYNKGLTYIQSLTTQKPLHARSKKG
ncbi:conserved Plasmodium protein, unknown function [Plasmodium ovale]|uniref:Uncharacterized protein n=2 Tax=Plasmodium ovale TaxID=36330 RepID=A0A1A8VLP2_PLAOA|nr:conserved Plasmodium protein, unknown function [Plasmodium ovale curtisi]SCP03878.1 conserved Plasmodium protein, unknown function [Plasmodium ovale]